MDRPEEDEWYLDEGIILLFNVDERAYLRELYEEEMHHFNVLPCRASSA